MEAKNVNITSSAGSLSFEEKSELLALNNYYPFGMLQPGLSYNSSEYRFGFNGMEKDDEIQGVGNSLDFGARFYDSRLGRFFTLDPLKDIQSGLSSYSFAANSPILYIDRDGKIADNAMCDFFLSRDAILRSNISEAKKHSLVQMEYDALKMANQINLNMITMFYGGYYGFVNAMNLGTKGLTFWNALKQTSLFVTNELTAVASASKVGIEIMRRHDVATLVPSSPLQILGKSLDLTFDTDYFEPFLSIAGSVKAGGKLSQTTYDMYVDIPSVLENGFKILDSEIFIDEIEVVSDNEMKIHTTINSLQMTQTLYLVKNGDNLSSIAKKYNTTYQKIMELNNLDSDEIYPNDVLLIGSGEDDN